MLYPRENFIVHDDNSIECKNCHMKIFSWNDASSHNCLCGKELLERNPQPSARPKPVEAPVKPVEPEKRWMLHDFT